ncbi:M15 family metallopeptidase [Falsibacillus albus]|nr:M15 family metallopeptidase [Falsibacillus albus]
MKKTHTMISVTLLLLSGCGVELHKHTSPKDNTDALIQNSDNSEPQQQEKTEIPPSNENSTADAHKQTQQSKEKESKEPEKQPEDQNQSPKPPQSQSGDKKQNTSQQKDDSSDSKASSQQKGLPTVADPAALQVMVNKSIALPKNYRPADLVRPNVAFSFGSQKLEKGLLRKSAAAALEKMFNGAKKDGIVLIAASGFRSYQTQAYLFNREVKQVGLKKAEIAVARPGTSEHQTGLTMDITSKSMNYSLGERFESTNEGKWLQQHAYEYGFIMRYPKRKEAITKYEYEPWHYRYVGIELANIIHAKGLTLEEYFGDKKGI